MDIHSRKSIRLKGYDYSKAGAYFITICCADKKCFFGTVENGEMRLNKIGEMAHHYFQQIPQHYAHVELGEFIVMPNHVHGVLLLNTIDDSTNTNDGTVDVLTRHDLTKPDTTNTNDGIVDVGTRHGVSLPDIPDTPVGSRHGVTAPHDGVTAPHDGVTAPHDGVTAPHDGVTTIRQFGKPISGSVSVIINQYKAALKRWCNKNGYQHFKWQSRFHDHVIRNAASFQTISDYIVTNPLKWNEDKFYTH